MAYRHYILDKGTMVWSGTTLALRRDQALKTRFLGV